MTRIFSWTQPGRNTRTHRSAASRLRGAHVPSDLGLDIKTSVTRATTLSNEREKKKHGTHSHARYTRFVRRHAVDVDITY